MTEKLMVIGRRKTSSDQEPSFTKTMPIDEMVAELNKTLPIDMLFFVVPHSDGKGYELREAGIVTAYVHNPDTIRTVAASVTPSEPSHQEIAPPPLPLPLRSVAVATEEPQPLQTPSQPVVETPSFTPMTSDDDFKFATPKSQTELLHERGLELEPVKGKIQKGKRKTAKAVESAGGNEQEISASDPRLQARGSVKITHIKTATPQEAAAASQFGKSN